MSRTVVVLGAGATKGAKFRERREQSGWRSRHFGAARPALDADFFDRLQHVAFPEESENGELIRNVIADARSISATYGFPTLEQAFTFVEAANRMAGKGLMIRGADPDTVMARLKKAIALQLGSCLWQPDTTSGNVPHYQCEHHHWLVDQLDVGDTIISFNYDCLADFSLKSRGGKAKWNPAIGYGVSATAPSDANFWWDGDKPFASTESIKCLKLHGSLNWDASSRETGLRLLGLPYATTGAQSIVPPVWDKRTKDWPFEHVWDQAKEAIANAMAIVFIGYSMPATDVSSQVLFRAGRQGKPLLQSVCVVNPDVGAGERVANVLKEAISVRTYTPRFSTWEDFREAPPAVWRFSN
jgi:hypothetical protein